jgi:signal transduction histidine kinase
LQIIVEDNGVGISEENIKKLFKDYSRLNEHQDMNAQGTGLGLSISKKLVENMSGSVQVKSKIGIGTRFITTLRLKAMDRKLKN